MGPAAAGAVIDFTVVIDGVISARAGIEEIAAGLDRTEHGAFLRNHLNAPTSGESLGFKDDLLPRPNCHSRATVLFQAGTFLAQTRPLLSSEPIGCGY
jgi:hypothetical protein